MKLSETRVEKIGRQIVKSLTFVTPIVFIIMALALTVGGCLGVIGFHW